MRTLKLAVVALIVGLFALPGTADAQHLTQVYEVQAKEGTGAGFEAALERHAQWREENGDPWGWNVYEVVQGKQLNTYVIRSTGHTWSDFDDYNQGFGPKGGRHFQATVGPLVKSMKSRIVRYDTARSHVGDIDPSLIEVVTFKIKPGAQQDWMEPVKQFRDAAVEEDYPIDFATVVGEAGAGSSQIRIAYLHENWADFQEPDQSAGELMEQVYGQQKASELYERYTSSFSSTYSMVVRPRPDLSVDAAGEEGGQ